MTSLGCKRLYRLAQFLSLYCVFTCLVYIFIYHASTSFGTFSGFSVGFCMKRRLFVSNLSSENNLPTFQLNAPVGCSKACVGEPPPDQLGGNHSAGPWQRIRRCEGGPTHPDDTLRGGLQLRWRTGSPWLLDHYDEETWREEQSSPTFHLQ